MWCVHEAGKTASAGSSCCDAWWCVDNLQRPSINQDQDDTSMVAAPVGLPLKKSHQTQSREQRAHWSAVGNDTAAWSWPLHTAVIFKEMDQTSEQTILCHFPLKSFLWWDGTTRGDLMTAIKHDNEVSTETRPPTLVVSQQDLITQFAGLSVGCLIWGTQTASFLSSSPWCPL